MGVPVNVTDAVLDDVIEYCPVKVPTPLKLDVADTHPVALLRGEALAVGEAVSV